MFLSHQLHGDCRSRVHCILKVKENIMLLQQNDKQIMLALTVLGPRYTKPDWRQKKNQAQHKYKKNIAMTDWLSCIQPEGSPSQLYSVCIYGELAFFMGLVYLGP